MPIFSRMFARARSQRHHCEKTRNRPCRTRLYLEPLESREMLHANVVLDSEHLAVFGSRDPVTQVISGGLVPDAAVTDRSLASGNWNDPTIWSNGVPHD